MNHRALAVACGLCSIYFCLKADLSGATAQDVAAGPMKKNGVQLGGGELAYSRERRLKFVEEQQWIIERDSAMSAAQKQQSIEVLIIQADSDHLTYLRSAEDGRFKDQAYSFARDLETKWRDGTAYAYVLSLSGVAVSLLDRINAPMDEIDMARRLVEGVVKRLPDVPTQVAATALLRFSRIQSSNGEAIIPMDWIPRETALDAYLRVLVDINTFLQIPASNAFAGLTEAEAWMLDSGNMPRTFGGARWNTPEDREEYRKRLEFLAERKVYEIMPGVDMDHRWGVGHEWKLRRAFTNHIHRHYTLSPADLDEVQVALEKYVKDPALRERLILAAYKGTNPFLGRTVNAKTVAVGGAQTSSSTGGIAAKHGAAAKSPKQPASQTVSGQRTEKADTLPLATASGVGAGQGALWVAFAGAAALIVLVLSRAQSRGASGGSK